MMTKDESICFLQKSLRLALEGVGYDYDKLAKLIGAHKQSIYKWQRGDSVPDGTHAVMLCSLSKRSFSERNR